MKTRINVIKIEEVNGKNVGKCFSFELDPVEMTQYRTLPTLRKKIEEYVIASRIFRFSEVKDLKYDMKEFLKQWRETIRKMEEKKLKGKETMEAEETKQAEKEEEVLDVLEFAE